MIKINYPILSKKIDAFHKNYRKAVIDNIEHQAEIEAQLNIIDFNGAPLTLDILLTLSIQDLISIIPTVENSFQGMPDAEINKFKGYFDYEELQPDIAEFFMQMDREKQLNLCSCYYCNIDYINIINDVGQYKDKVHFLNEAQEKELELIPGVGESTVEKIIAERPFTGLDLNFLSPAKQTAIRNYSINKANRYKNHFTLDHFLPKSAYRYFALSLYNLIPCCYSCNSKFKGVQEFEVDIKTALLSPTSIDFILEKNPLFNLRFAKAKDKDSTKDLKDIMLSYDGFVNGEKRFLEIFALQGRYEFHKKEALNLILKYQAYPDSAITEIAKTLKQTKDELSIRKDIFGSSLYNPLENNQPLAKFKKDIAEKIGLIPSP